MDFLNVLKEIYVTNKISIIITGILIIMWFVGYFGGKIRKKSLINDPEYQKKLEERAAEYRRKQEEDKMLDDVINSDTHNYNDEPDDSYYYRGNENEDIYS